MRNKNECPFFLNTEALHFNTFGGNPMASAVGIAVLDALEEGGCQQISKDVGTYFLLRLAELREKYEVTHSPIRHY